MKWRELTISLTLFFVLTPLSECLIAQNVQPQDVHSSKDSIYFMPDDEEGVYTSEVTMKAYDKRVHHYRKRWESMIPTQFVVQNAGNMGFLSFGVGWSYGKRNQWETHQLIGFIPKYKSTRAKVTITIKENYIPWSIYMGKGMQIEPLRTGLYLNSVFGTEFWNEQPSRYPNDYYEFLSTKFRLNLFVGQGVTKIVPKNHLYLVKSVSFFYELGTCDLYIRAKVQDHSVKFWDLMGLSLGFRFQLL
ncbi:MAG: hypothetical protein IKX59_00875 [Bacteroidales bacterium]|nr:hypothetical protein [Bacteroidales bacterium]